MRIFRILSLAMILSGCAAITEPFGIEDPFAIPQTFKGVERNDEMLHPGSGITTVVVELPKGLSDEFASLLQGKIIRDLDGRDIGAVNEPMEHAWTLKGRAALVVESESFATKRGVVVWRLFDPDHKQKGQFSTAYTGSSVSDVVPRAADLAKLVGDKIIGIVNPERAAQAGASVDVTAAAEQAQVWIGAIKGAPGDGGLALARALRVALPEKGLHVVDDAGKAAWRIECDISLKKVSAAEDHVTLVWRLLDAHSKEAGTLKQENPVPRGRLDKNWGDIAGFAAEGAAEGVQQILQQIRGAKPN